MDNTALFDLSYGLYVIGTLDGRRPVGCVVNTVFQVIAQPATVAVSINHDNFTNECVKRTGRLAISILSEDADRELFGTFGFSSGREKDKFENYAFELCDIGMPVLYEKTTAYLAGEVVGSYELSTHTVFFVQIKEAEKLFGKPMTYAYYHAVVKGKAPKNAPTYVEEKPKASAETEKGTRWVCSVCGYVYDGETPFEELPEEWACPICGMGKDKFRKE